MSSKCNSMSNAGLSQSKCNTVDSNDNHELNSQKAVTTDAAPEVNTNIDVISYCGNISKVGYLKLTQLIEDKIQKDSKSDNLLLILTTTGGDPDAGYRIGRAINYYYDDVKIMIPDMCKSAGTLVAIAANELIIGDLGELGPLDVQLRKSDEMGEQSSSLNIFTTIQELQQATLSSFRHFVTDIRYGTRVGTKLAANIASDLTKSLISPISAQIDPIKLGEQKRALQIAKEYASRLDEMSNNLRSSGALDKLISGYPCHSFVIDRKEAKTLFNNVRGTEDENEELLYRFSRLYLSKIEHDKIYSEEQVNVGDFVNIIKMMQQESDPAQDP
ncbi:SDH family Clp fold serine proteinase, partial [Moritella viscosa]|uniref:SDH family Clp fold serine proteinase n=1 Tax=Moritella viscosa TaxID=80854 RepID=UPI000913252B